MDPVLSEDQELFRATTRKFLEDTSTPRQTRALETNSEGFERRWWRQGAELGWTSPLLPEHLGGGSLAGEGLLDLVVVAEEFGRLVAPGPLLPVNVVAETIARSGTAEHQALLPAVVAGEAFLAWAFYEGVGPWDASGVRLQGELVDGWFTLRGKKSLVEAANVADAMLVTARTAEGLTQFLVPAAASGVTIRPMTGLDLVRRYSEVTFDEVSLPPSAVVGEVGGAAADVERQLQVAVVLQCAETVGAVERVFDFTFDYLSDRYSFGRPLNSYQALKHRMADNAVHLHECLGVATAAAQAVQRQSSNAAEMVSGAKAWIGEKATDLVQDCVQLHGGIGVTWEHDIHLYLRRATVNRVTYGTPEEHRDRIAQLIGL
jgi:alkylation response protein AidB-like acyl-CoA dehydrogenase